VSIDNEQPLIHEVYLRHVSRINWTQFTWC